MAVSGAPIAGQNPKAVLLAGVDGSGVAQLLQTPLEVSVAAGGGASTPVSGEYGTSAVGGAAVEVLAEDANRSGFIIVNQGIPSGAHDEVFWGMDASVEVPTGLPGDKSGGTLPYQAVLSSDQFPNYNGPIYAISSGNTHLFVAVW